MQNDSLKPDQHQPAPAKPVRRLRPPSLPLRVADTTADIDELADDPQTPENDLPAATAALASAPPTAQTGPRCFPAELAALAEQCQNPFAGALLQGCAYLVESMNDISAAAKTFASSARSPRDVFRVMSAAGQVNALIMKQLVNAGTQANKVQQERDPVRCSYPGGPRVSPGSQ